MFYTVYLKTNLGFQHLGQITVSYVYTIVEFRDLYSLSMCFACIPSLITTARVSNNKITVYYYLLSLSKITWKLIAEVFA